MLLQGECQLFDLTHHYQKTQAQGQFASIWLLAGSRLAKQQFASDRDKPLPPLLIQRSFAILESCAQESSDNISKNIFTMH